MPVNYNVPVHSNHSPTVLIRVSCHGVEINAAGPVGRAFPEGPPEDNNSRNFNDDIPPPPPTPPISLFLFSGFLRFPFLPIRFVKKTEKLGGHMQSFMFATWCPPGDRAMVSRLVTRQDQVESSFDGGVFRMDW